MAIVVHRARPADPVEAAALALVEAAHASPLAYSLRELEELVSRAALSEGVLDRMRAMKAALGASPDRQFGPSTHEAHLTATYPNKDPKFNRERAEEWAKSAHEDATSKGFSHSSGTVKVNGDSWHHSHGKLHDPL